MDTAIEYMHSPTVLITLTILIYWGANALHDRFRTPLLNPMVITIALIIIILKSVGFTYEDYRPSGRMIEFWLQPAIVALGLPLYNELKHIRSQFFSLLITELTGCVVGIVSVVLIAKWAGATPDVIRSLAPKSVSTPIAIEIARQTGGIPALTSAIVVMVGMIGAMIGLKFMKIFHISHPVSMSLSMGTAAHVMGTNRIVEYGDRYGAYATLGLILNGILTAFLAGPLLALIL